MTGSNVIRSVHPYPARMAPAIAYDVLQGYRKPMRLLDPMVGSGITLQVGRACGHHVIGYDIDPLAVLVTRTNCSNLDPSELIQAARRVADAAKDQATKLSEDAAFPTGSDKETRDFVSFWFDTINRRELTGLTEVIRKLRTSAEMKRALWTVLSGTIVTKKIGVSLAADVSHSRPHRIYTNAPVTAIDAFLRRATWVAKTLSAAPEVDRTLSVAVRRGNAKKLPLPAESIDVVVTSPPYMTAIDYLRGHRLSLVWLGYTLAQVRSVNASPAKRPASDAIKRIAVASISTPDQAISVDSLVEKYVVEMNAITKEIARTLVPGGTVVMVVGTPTVKGVRVDTAGIFKLLASSIGLAWVGESIRDIPETRRYLPSPTYVSNDSPLRKRLTQESVLMFVKKS